MFVFSTLVWTSAPLTFSRVHIPPLLPFPVWISTGVYIHAPCNRGCGGASDRLTPAAKYLYGSVYKKSRHFGFGYLIYIGLIGVQKISYQKKTYYNFLQIYLKGQCHEIFCYWFFLWISFPPAPEYPIRTVSNFFENSRRYSQVKVHHRC